MSFFDIIDAAAEGGDVNALRSQLGPAIGVGLGEGMSGAAMLGAFRDAGGTIRTYDFQRLVGEVRASQSAAGAWIGQALDSVPGADLFVQHTGSAFQGYEYRVPVFYRDNSDPEHAVEHTVFTVRVDTPITGAEAQQQALEIFQEGAGDPNYENQEFLGFGTPGLHQFGS